MNANVPMLDEVAGKNTKEVIDALNETIRQQQAEIDALKKEAALQRLSDFTQEAECKHGVDDGACKECYQEATEPAKELHLSLQKSKQTGELLAVTYTDDEHRIVEVLWQRPPELTDEEILEVWRENERVYPLDRSRLLDRTRACIRKASEK